MGSYVNGNKVSFGESIALSAAMREVAALLGVARRADGKYYLSDICRAGSINPAARYKPVRSSKNANITDADRDAVAGGFGETPQIEPYNAGIPHAVYEYDKPRGSAVSPTEWFRLRDFNGYNHEAVFPFHVYFPEILYKEAENIIYCIANNPDIDGWDAENCLALADMVDETTRGYNVALLVHRGSSLWLMPSDIKVRDLSASNFPIFRIGRNAEALAQSPSNMMYDYILSDLDSAEGEEYTMAFVATHLGYQTNQNPVPSYAIPTMRSLELTYDSDRKTLIVVSAQTIEGVSGYLATSSWNYTTAADPSGLGGMGVIKFDSSQKVAVSVTAPASWRRDSVYINVQMINEGGMIYNNGVMLAEPVVNIGKGIALTAGKTREVDIFSFASPNQYWFQYATSAHKGGIRFIITAYRNSSMTGESVELQSISVAFPEI